jgi:lipooligosaccharide transport system permease protein
MIEPGLADTATQRIWSPNVDASAIPDPATGRLFLREFRYRLTVYRRRWRGSIVISVVNPLLFLLAIGVGLGRVVAPASPTLGGVSYLAFFAPGMLAAASMQNGIVEGGFPVSLAVRRGGSYQIAASSPLEPEDILLGHVLYMTLRVAMSAAAFLVVMVTLGAARSPLVLLDLPAATLTGVAFAVPVAAWVVTLEQPGRVGTLFKWVVMPLYLFSGTFFSVAQLPVVLRVVAYVTPLWHGVALCRSLSEGTATWAGSAGHAGYLLGLTALGLLAARRTFHHRLHT